MNAEGSPEPTTTTPITGVADVLCDGSGRVGALSYIVPDGVRVGVGDAVEVPFGPRVTAGVVLGPGDPQQATRDIRARLGVRATPAEIELAREIAEEHFCETWRVAARLAPRKGKGADPVDAGAPATAAAAAEAAALLPDDPPRRRVLLRAPLADPAALAAAEAAAIADRSGDQVIVLCPTGELVSRVEALLPGGAARVDAHHRDGAWRGLVEGTLRIAVGTRAAALYSTRQLGGIVVVEEDHPGHVEHTMPHTHAAAVAARRAAAADAELAVISANPTAAALAGGVRAVEVGGDEHWPRLRLVDRDDIPPSDRALPPQVADALDQASAEGRAAVVVAPHARATRRCGRCGEVRDCDRCGDGTHPVDCRHDLGGCAVCGDRRTKVRGWDPRRVGDAVAAWGATVAAAHELAASPQPRTVVVWDLDAAFSRAALDPDRPAARTLLAAAEAAGPGGEVVAVTGELDHPVVRAVAARRPRGLAVHSWRTAQRVGLPPFQRLVRIRVGRDAKPRTSGMPGRVLGPRKVDGEWEVLVQIPHERLGGLAAHVARIRRPGKTRVTVR